MDAHMYQGWLRVPYDGSPNATLVITCDSQELPAFYDRDDEGPWAQVRVQPSSPVARVTLTADGVTVSSGRVRM